MPAHAGRPCRILDRPGLWAVASDHPLVPPTMPGGCKKASNCSRTKVRPELIAHCLECHGGKAIKGGLDLSDRDGLVAAAVLDGGGEASRLAALIRHTEMPHMPQKAPKLADETIAAIVRWIDCGAPYDRPLVPRPTRGAGEKAVPAKRDAAILVVSSVTDRPPPPRYETRPGSARQSIALYCLHSKGKG